jgi:hypothetical protein
MSLKDTPEYQFGREGERRIQELFKRTGWYVVATADYTGGDAENEHAPVFQGKHDSPAMPDLDVSKDGVREWVEVKRKTDATWTRITQRWEFSFGLRAFEGYLKIQRESGCRVRIVIIEESTDTCFWNWLDVLAPLVRRYKGPKLDAGGNAFFPRDAFHVDGEYVAPEKTMLIDGKRVVIPPAETSKKRGPEQQDLF